jgi:DegV family protein with EDD domain
MKPYILATDSCSDLTVKLVQTLEIEIIPLSVELEGINYQHYPDERQLSIQKFYQELRNKKIAKTSLINTGQFLNFFEPFLQKGQDILYIAFSSALSGTYQSSVIAARELMEQYPGRKIITLDSKSASMGQGLLVYLAGERKMAGQSIEEVATFVESVKLSVCHLFTVDDLGTLKRGGRLSDTQAFLGTLLRVKPILHVSNEGKLVPLKKARGREFSLEQMIDMMQDRIIDPELQTMMISHGDCLEEAKSVGQAIQNRYHVKNIIYNTIGPIIGAHSGPGTIAIFFLGTFR